LDLKDILVISDLDGTLIGRHYDIPERNLKAIERFQRKGGHFAVATGRSIASGARYYAQVSPNGPCVILNGTMVYDFTTKKMLWNLPLRLGSAKKYITMIQNRFPSAGIEVFGTQDLGVLNSNDYIVKHLAHEKMTGCNPEIFDGRPLCKALFADDADVIQNMIAFTETFEHDDVRFVTSCENYLEMLPADADKGIALKKLMDICGYSAENVYAIGDYYNDVELLQAAGFAAMPKNSPDELKHHADLIVCDCGDGAVADLIEYIEREVIEPPIQ
jgi:Cof subfamily protein (haloacid dehalogenase superfamily)